MASIKAKGHRTAPAPATRQAGVADQELKPSRPRSAYSTCKLSGRRRRPERLWTTAIDNLDDRTRSPLRVLGFRSPSRLQTIKCEEVIAFAHPPQKGARPSIWSSSCRCPHWSPLDGHYATAVTARQVCVSTLQATSPLLEARLDPAHVRRDESRGDSRYRMRWSTTWRSLAHSVQVARGSFG